VLETPCLAAWWWPKLPPPWTTTSRCPSRQARPTAAAAVSSAGLAFGAGMLLIGWAMGLSDHILASEQDRLTDRLRNLVSRT